MQPRVALLAGVFPVLVWCLAGPASAQEPIRFGERIDVEVVDLDVFVTDRAGALVRDLEKDDFTVLVNGEPAAIVDFSAHVSSEEPAGHETGVTPPPAARGELTRGAPKDPELSRVWLIYLDMLRTGEARRMTAIRAVLDFIESSMQPGDRAMVALFDGAALRVVQSLTGERDAVAATLRGLSRRAAPSRHDLLAFQLDEEDRYRRELAAIRALKDFIALAGGGSERRQLLLIGGGYLLDGWNSIELATRLRREYETLRDTLAASDITLHSVWAWKEGLTAVGADMPGDLEPQMDGPAPETAPLSMGSTVSTLARDTGGVSLLAAPGLDQRLARAGGTAGGYYSLAFRTPANTDRSRFDIRVRVVRDGVRVRHRRLLRLSTDSEVSRQATMEALLATRSVNPWKVGVRVGRVFGDRLRRFRAPVEIHVPLEHVLLMEREGRHFGHLRFFFGVRDASGNYTSVDPKDLELELTGEQVAALHERGLRYTLELVVSSGTTDCAVTVADVIARTRSTARFKIAAGRR